MVDGRLLAAYRSLYEAAVAAGLPQEQQPAGLEGRQGQPQPVLGDSWSRHVQLAVAARCREILQRMPTPLLADLERLAEWERRGGEAPHRWTEAQRHYAAAVAAHEARHGGLHSVVTEEAPPSAVEGSSSNGVGAGVPNLLDAGADATLARLLLQQAQTQQPSGGGAADDGGSSAAAGSASVLPLVYRAYKKMTLWDGMLLADQ